jgi:cyclophilin family peptidyl-prolyl cis-trans isomerase
MNWKLIIVYLGMVSALMFSGEVVATTIVSGDLSIRDGGDLVFSDGSVQSKAQVQGPAGPAGPANNLTIGTVTSGATAAASITGTTPNQVLNLTLPQGPPGPAITLASICDAIRAGGAPVPAFCLPTSATSITSPAVMYAKQSGFTVTGSDLGSATVTAFGACSSLTEVAGGTSSMRTFTCIPASVGTVTVSVTADGALLQQTQFTVPNPQVTFSTSKGTIVVELNPSKAPVTVNNFLRYVNEGFYNNTIFHRVVSGFVIQGGGYRTDGVQKATHPPIELEPPSATGLTNSQGTIAMARTSTLISATSEFFFSTVNNNPNTGVYSGTNLDLPAEQGYTVFGSVIQGFDVVKTIEAVPVTGNVPITAVVVTSASQTK